jgi:hypothetical protein
LIVPFLRLSHIQAIMIRLSASTSANQISGLGMDGK